MGLMLGALWLALPNQGESLAWEKSLPIVLSVIFVLALVLTGVILGQVIRRARRLAV